MDGVLAFLLVLVLFVFLLAVGMHIGTVLIVSGMIGTLLVGGFSPLMGVVQDSSFYSVATYSLTTIPLFILMAQFIVRAKIIGLLYHFLFRISGEKGGVLGAFTMLLGSFLGALSGSPTAISAALAQISLPELRKHGFNKYLGAATVAMAGSLSTIIPPSIIIIVYGAATTTSIGELFIAMTFPIIIIVTILFVAIFVLFHFTSNSNEQINNKAYEEISSGIEPEVEPNIKNYTISVGSLVVIIGAIFLGIFFGIFTPTEAGAVGAFLSLVMVALLKQISIGFFKEAISETINITGMVLFIILGASIFGKFITLTLVPTYIINWINPLLDTPMLLMLVLLGIYFFLFMIIEGIAVILITVSISLPIVTEAGYDPIVFGVLLTIVCAAGLLTPPVGLSVYSVAGVAKLPVQKIFLYGSIYALIITIAVIPILLFPEIITWLPEKM